MGDGCRCAGRCPGRQCVRHGRFSSSEEPRRTAGPGIDHALRNDDGEQPVMRAPVKRSLRPSASAPALGRHRRKQGHRSASRPTHALPSGQQRSIQARHPLPPRLFGSRYPQIRCRPNARGAIDSQAQSVGSIPVTRSVRNPVGKPTGVPHLSHCPYDGGSSSGHRPIPAGAAGNATVRAPISSAAFSDSR